MGGGDLFHVIVFYWIILFYVVCAECIKIIFIIELFFHY